MSMASSTVEVGELVSTLSAAGVQRQLSTLLGVRHADVNYVAGSATVHCDEAKITLDAIRQLVVDCGYHCRGELAPAHVCEPADHTTAPAKHGHAGHGDHTAHAASGTSSPDNQASNKADMMHDMGPASGMSMQGMADDMRNRFLVALAFALPVFLYSPMGAMNGILFKNASALENATKLTVVVFDKTGLLTIGQPDVVEVATATGVSEAQLLAVAAGVEEFSEHPLAQAVLKRAGNAPLVAATNFANIDGQGARASIGTEAVLLGNCKLQERGVKVAITTGDNQATADRIGKELGIDIVLAEVLPGHKAAKIKELQDQGHKVGMVGDGINAAPALTQADVGFAIGAGTDVAMESAQVVLMKSAPYDVVAAIELSRATLRKMHQNLSWAVGYNVIAFPLAAGVFYPFTLSPEIAALSMSGSSAVVAINALMHKRTKLAGIKRVGSPGAQSTATNLAARASA